ncbi:hypothetical protein C0J52_24418 [Blattella germanica]|nr:hypothetical protein C0J52_24418 [Blattella germanica]
MKLALLFSVVAFSCLAKMITSKTFRDSAYVDLLMEINKDAEETLNTIFFSSAHERKENVTYNNLSNFLQSKIQEIHKNARKIYDLQHIPSKWNRKSKEQLQNILQVSKQLKVNTDKRKRLGKQELKEITKKLVETSRNIKGLAQDYYYAQKRFMTYDELADITEIILNFNELTSKALKILSKM